jgi:hypothetical protein
MSPRLLASSRLATVLGGLEDARVTELLKWKFAERAQRDTD